MNEDMDDEIEGISKSKRKRDADEMQALGKRLTKLRPAQRGLLPLTETLISAIEEYNRLPKSFAARSRQLQYIGRLMRESDYAEIASELDRLESPNYISAKTKLKRAAQEQATNLLAEGDSIINALVEKYPSLDRQQLRQLHREYLKAKESKQAALLSRCMELLTSAMSSD